MRTPASPASPLIGWMNLRLAIPWRIALPHCGPPLHKPFPSCAEVVLPLDHFPSNGQLCLNCLSHARGAGPPGTPALLCLDFFRAFRSVCLRLWAILASRHFAIRMSCSHAFLILSAWRRRSSILFAAQNSGSCE